MLKKDWEKIKNQIDSGEEYLILYTMKGWKELYDKGKIKSFYRHVVRYYIGESEKVRNKLIFSHNFQLNINNVIAIKKLRKK